MMNKLRLSLVMGLGLMLGSCTTMHTAIVTNNPVGSKTGVVKTGFMKKDVDLTYSGAMKKGGISKVGIAEMKGKIFIFPSVIVSVTGE